MCEACDRLLFEGIESPALFLAAVRTLEALSSCAEGGARDTAGVRLEDGKSGSSYVLLRFLLTALKEAGYPVSAAACPHCGEQLSGRMRFDMESGAFGCEACGGGVPASESTYLAVRAALGQGGEVTADGVKRALRLLSAYFAFQASELPSLAEYLRL